MLGAGPQVKRNRKGTFTAVQWLRLHLPMQGVRAQSQVRGPGIPRASWPKNQSIKQKQYCNKFNKDFKNVPHQKESKKDTEINFN